MQLTGDNLLFSATDLINFLECEHLTWLDLEATHQRLTAEPKRADAAKLVARKGREHERRYLEGLRAEGNGLVEIPDAAPAVAIEATLQAMRSGAEVIHQAALRDGLWRGYADFLERLDGVATDLGEFGYEAADTKLARRVKPYFLLQLCLYSELIGSAQGRPPELMHVALGTGERESFRVADFSAYFRRIRRHLEELLAAGLDETYPDPVEHCALCRWSDLCDGRRLADDHLSLVAGMGRVQVTRLAERGITTVARLASSGADERPRRVGADTFERLRQQARLQVSERDTGEQSYELLAPAPERGFALLPEPDEGDVFFDIEGDPFYDDGLEYLFGVAWREGSEERFRAFWGTDRRQERLAFQAFVDWVGERRRRYPNMHIYHYASYEPTALKRLMGLHATREDEVDGLLRGRVMVDLYRVVHQGLRISKPSYSIKKVEAFYMPEREASVTDGEDSILKFEEWLDSGDGELLDWIERYNEEDCVSTLRLRDWLLERRSECAAHHGHEIPWRPCGAAEVPEAQAEELGEVARLQRSLWEGLSEEPSELPDEERPRWLLGQLLDYHRREDKPAWWELFARLERTEEDLRELDGEALACIEPDGEPAAIGGRSPSARQPMHFPAQEHKVRSGTYLDPFSAKREPNGALNPFSCHKWEVLEIDDAQGTLSLKVTPTLKDAPLPRALIPGRPIPNEVQREALRELARAGSAEGLDSETAPHRAARALLCRELPRSTALAPAAALQDDGHELDRTRAIARGLDRSYLFIQGPPGSGKTYTGAMLILDLLAAGRRVGIAAPTHKAISNLLAEIEEHAPPGRPFAGLKKSGDDDCFQSNRAEPLIGNAKSPAAFPTETGVELMAGTAWLWCREQMRETVDYLVIDEAGQVSLADALAMATSARNVILLGDPLQLAHVSQAIHPEGSGVSILEHLLGSNGTIPRDRGVFLDQSRRMHGDVCDFISRAIYEDRLTSVDFCDNQRIDADGPLTGTGVRALLVDHDANTRSSPEEAAVVTERIDELIGARYTMADGTSRDLKAGDMMVVSPYNAQVRCLRERLDAAGLDDVSVGTVDKFQGQEAPVVFFSMATSSGEEIPRNVEFLYSRNRLNVAVSRAKCLAVLVCNPNLLTIRCRSIEQMRLVNALCLLVELAEEQEAVPRSIAASR